MDATRHQYRLAALGFALIAKAGARRLQRINATLSVVPFAYDPEFFASLRPDQTPRFLGALTNPDALPMRILPMASLIAIQDRVDHGKIADMRGKIGGKPPVVVRHNGQNYIADGHHRAAAAYLDGKDEIAVHYKDLTPYSLAMKARTP